jgi:hypothetical protein
MCVYYITDKVKDRRRGGRRWEEVESVGVMKDKDLKSVTKVSDFCCLFASEYDKNKTRTEGKKCHTKTMTSRKTDETLKDSPNMCHLGRTLRKKNERGD